MYAIDLFCGAGGFSEGITQAGFHIVFSSDISEHVMKTYKNRHEELGLKQGYNTHFALRDISELTGKNILDTVNSLDYFKGKELNEIDAIFGGPPCQGFSRAGRRDKNDPRNMLFKQYVRVISEIVPKYVVMENVEGFMDTRLDNFIGVSKKKYAKGTLVSEILKKELTLIGYTVLNPRLLDSSNYGVPQRRLRAVFIAHREDVQPPAYPAPTTGDEESKVKIWQALCDLKLTNKRKEKNQQKITEYIQASQRGRTPHLETKMPIPLSGKLENCETSRHTHAVMQRFALYDFGESTGNVEKKILEKGFNVDKYQHLFWECVFVANREYNIQLLDSIFKKVHPEIQPIDLEEHEKMISSLLNKLTNILIGDFANSKNIEQDLNKKLKRLKVNSVPLEEMKQIYHQFISECNKEISPATIKQKFKKQQFDDDLMECLLTKKNTRSRLHPDRVSPTMLTLPDDFISPYEDRILSVREMARLQSFDDSFKFLGKRTTGGTQRKKDVPQYTQVGNAVPPLLAFAIAKEIYKALIKEEQLVKQQ
jgi:DNA (cytosine-5)-methyltransferase 1